MLKLLHSCIIYKLILHLIKNYLTYFLVKCIHPLIYQIEHSVPVLKIKFIISEIISKLIALIKISQTVNTNYKNGKYYQQV